MTGSARSGEASDDLDRTRQARDLFECREAVAELEDQIRQQVEARRFVELELAAAKRDIEVRTAYNEALERLCDEQHEQLVLLRDHIAALDAAGLADTVEAVAKASRAEAHVAAERDRAALMEAQRLAAQATTSQLEGELAAYRARTSTVFADAVAKRFTPGGRIFRLGRRLVRTMSRAERR